MYIVTNRIGEKNKMSNGQMAQIIAYRKYNDIDIRFEDKTIITNKNYNNFKKGKISNPNYSIGNIRIGEKNKMNNGQMAEIIIYRKHNDINIRFEDGTVITNKTYTDFKKGQIRNPDYSISNIRIGEKSKMNNGQMAEIIAYRKYIDIDIRFEDGTVVTNRMYNAFKKGQIRNPNYSIGDIHIGEKNKMNNGQMAEIIIYRKHNDINIRFEDGTVVTNKDYNNFKKGKISNPNYSISNIRIGEKNKMNNGQMAEIIAYHGSNDIDVRLEDGTIVTNKTYKAFKKGKISNPNYSISNIRIGEKNKTNNGQMAEIIAYHGSNDIDVRLEDGTIVTNKTYKAFKKGQIRSKMICNNIKIIRKAYVYNNKTNFFCKCQACGLADIMTIDEMKQHKCL